MLLKNHFRGPPRKFSRSLTRLTEKELGPYLALRRSNDRVSQPEAEGIKSRLCEISHFASIFCVLQFSSFSTLGNGWQLSCGENRPGFAGGHFV